MKPFCCLCSMIILAFVSHTNYALTLKNVEPLLDVPDQTISRDAPFAMPTGLPSAVRVPEGSFEAAGHDNVGGGAREREVTSENTRRQGNGQKNSKKDQSRNIQKRAMMGGNRNSGLPNKGHGYDGPPPQGGETVGDFNSLSLGAGQMMSRWMLEAKRRYPEDFEKLVMEWMGIMADFENISIMGEGNVNAHAVNMSSVNETGMSPSKEFSEKPRYSVLCTSLSGYELRQYEPALWINTVVNTSSYDFAGMIGFKRLYEYIHGKNSQGVKIPMTIPLRKRIRSFTDEISPVSLLRDESFKVSFYLPEWCRQNPPEPLDDELFIESSAYLVYAFNFSGWAYGLNVYEKYFECFNSLSENDEQFEKGEFSMQMYDSPWVSDDRHNELLIPVNHTMEGTPTCINQQDYSDLTKLENTCPCIVDIKTISSRKGLHLKLLQAGVFAAQTRGICRNLTDIINGMDLGYSASSQQAIRSVYRVLGLPTFLKVRQTSEDGSHGDLSYQILFYLPEELYDTLPESRIIKEGSLRIDSTNPTLYYVMNIPLKKLDNADIQSQYNKMRRILRDRGYCYSEDTLFIAYRTSHYSLQSVEMYISVDLQCAVPST